MWTAWRAYGCIALLGNTGYENEKKQFNVFDMMISGQRELRDPG